MLFCVASFPGPFSVRTVLSTHMAHVKGIITGIISIGADPDIVGPGGDCPFDFKVAVCIKVLIVVFLKLVTGAMQTEALPDVENLTGSGHNDVLAGDRRDNVLADVTDMPQAVDFLI